MGPGGQLPYSQQPLIEPVSWAILIQSKWLYPILKLILVKKDTNWNQTAHEWTLIKSFKCFVTLHKNYVLSKKR